MKAGFFTVFRRDPIHYDLAKRLVQSIRTTMPGVLITHFTDETSPSVLGVDEVVRKPNGKILERRLECYAECEGEWLLLDTDVFVRKDVRHVFDDPFDIAIADRDWPHLPQRHDVFIQIPYNEGVVFSRSTDFWRTALEEWRRANTNDWMSSQRAVWQAIRSGRFHVKVLSGREYNYPPRRGDDPHDAAILHFKGHRKVWMR